MKIAVIDGVISKLDVFRLTGTVILEGYSCVGSIKRRGVYSHGTVCAALLAEAAPTVDIIAVSVADEAGVILIENVCRGLEYCIEHSPEYICMSIGTSDWRETGKLRKLTQKLAEQGVKIFCANSNEGCISFPAAYPFVFSISCQSTLEGKYRFWSPCFGHCIIVGSFSSKVLDSLECIDDVFKMRTNSMATPWILGKMISESFCISDLPKEPLI